MTDVAISKKFGIPIQSLQNWKKRDKANWRHKLYVYLKKDKDC